MQRSICDGECTIHFDNSALSTPHCINTPHHQYPALLTHPCDPLLTHPTNTTLLHRRRTLVEPANLLVVCDLTHEQTRVLIGDTLGHNSKAVQPIMHLNVSLGEACLMMSVWYDNMFEEESFFAFETKQTNKNAPPSGVSPHKPSVHKSHSNAPSLSTSTSIPSPPPPQPYSIPSYGSVAYIDQLRNEASTWEVVVVRAMLTMDCAMDLGYFPETPSSVRFLDPRGTAMHTPPVASDHATNGNNQTNNNSRSQSNTMNAAGGGGGGGTSTPTWTRRALPIAQVALTNGVLHTRGNANTTQLAFSVGGSVTVLDTRSSTTNPIPVLKAETPMEDWITSDTMPQR